MTSILSLAHRARTEPYDDDAAREGRIDRLSLELLAAAVPDDRRRIFAELRAEIAARSPAAIERLERERGLSRGGW